MLAAVRLSRHSSATHGHCHYIASTTGIHINKITSSKGDQSVNVKTGSKLVDEEERRRLGVLAIVGVYYLRVVLSIVGVYLTACYI